MRPVPRWALVSSGCAPVLLAGGWMLAAHLEGPSYDPVTQNISVLGAYGSRGFWVMTGALLALGVCHLLTAWGLRAAALAGRVTLAAGGVAAFVVAILPAPSSGGSLEHGSVAVIGFVLLAAWPVLGAVRVGAAPWGLRLAPSIAASVLMGVGAAWYLIETHRHGAPGVAERLVTCMQSVWPFIVVASCVSYREQRARATADVRSDEGRSRPS
ncbi:DUF998 domain-containing protein [Streptomyces sp. NPDC046316]|uniref:DUF998 domain-containing protein n=1 Tax=Streptomyces sp. NPDC046316 TaxID=3154494 RepID=UPI0034038BCD